MEITDNVICSKGYVFHLQNNISNNFVVPILLWLRPSVLCREMSWCTCCVYWMFACRRSERNKLVVRQKFVEGLWDAGRTPCKFLIGAARHMSALLRPRPSSSAVGTCLGIHTLCFVSQCDATESTRKGMKNTLARDLLLTCPCDVSLPGTFCQIREPAAIVPN